MKNWCRKCKDCSFIVKSYKISKFQSQIIDILGFTKIGGKLIPILQKGLLMAAFGPKIREEEEPNSWYLKLNLLLYDICCQFLYKHKNGV